MLVQGGDVQVRLTGEAPIDQEELESVAKDAGGATFLSFSLVCVLLAVGFRSLRLVVATLVTLLVGLAWTAAFTTFAIGHLNLISVAFAVLFIGLGVDFGIQFAMRYREEFHHVKSHAEALARTAAGIGGVLMLAATAAALGFFSFIPTSYRGLAELGIISGVSMFLALLANLTVLPALLTLLPIDPRPRRREGRVLARLRVLVQRQRRLILCAAALAGVAGAVLAPQARFDFNPLNMKDPTTESVATFLELLRDPQTTPYTIQVLAENLDTAKTLAARLGELAVVDKTVTLASFVPDDQEEKLNIINDMSLVLQPLVMPAGNGTPLDPAEELRAYDRFRGKLVKAGAAQPDSKYAENISRLARALERLQAAPGWPDRTLQELRQRIVSDLPDHLARLRRLLKPGRVGLADLPPELAARYVAPDGRARIEVFPKQDMSDNQALRRFVKEVRAVAPRASGTPVALVEGGNAVIRACLEAAALSLFAAFVLMLAVLRSVIDALLVLLPMLLAALLTTATSVLFDLPFNLANIIALPLLLAISIAFGIYLVMRRRSGVDMKHLFHTSTPRAVLFSALTTVVAFGSMAFSDHRGMSGMGLLLTLSLSFALLCTLVVLPAIMAESEEKR
ncbi:MAG: MMPL family transporter [Betaproteobacteria bacterium]|nr:MMPL family transporter [Betaproteobacteria bacterium]